MCVAKTRLLVHENIKEQVLTSIQEGTKEWFTIGNPLDEQTTLGPIAGRKQLDRVNSYLEIGKKEGANLHFLETSGQLPSTGYFIQPTVFDNAKNTMRIAQEEIFGPILSVITFKTDDEAIKLANDVNYGLAATAWTQDLSRARHLVRDLEAGNVEIRATTTAAVESSALSGEPFGASGFGVLGGLRGLEPYTRLKAVQFITD